MKICVPKAIYRIDESGNFLDVSHPQFNKDPKKVYDVPDNPYWIRLLRKGQIYLAPVKSVPKKAEPATKKTGTD